MSGIEGWVANAALQLHDGVLRLTRAQQLRLEEMAGDLRHLPVGLIRQRRLELEGRSEAFRQAVGAFIRQEQQRIVTSAELIESRSPKRILRMGFAVVRGQGRAVRSIAEVTAGQRMEVEVADGRFTVEALAESEADPDKE